MSPKRILRGTISRNLLVLLCAVSIGSGDALAVAVSPRAMAQGTSAEEAASAIPPDQLDSLVAPIALYPDPLLAQTLAASTYPLELMQLQQWLTRNPGLKDKALAEAAAKQPWDPSIQAMAALPDVVKRLADDIQWTTDLGNAFLAQQADVMDAVQRMRRKAEGTGNLKSTPQQVVETRVVENKSVVVIEQASPEVVYVPSYNPAIVYGAPVYPYPPIYYPPAGAYAAGMAISFGVGVAMGAAWGGGGWGWNAGWGHNDITINNNNNFNRNANANFNRNANVNRGAAGNTWQHQPQHRGGAPYRDRSTANKYGGTARGDSLSNRQAGARQQVARQGGNVAARDRAGATGTSGIAGGASRDRAGTGAAQRDRAGTAGATGGAARDRAGTGAAPRDRAGSASGISNRPSGSGGDRVGQRDVSRPSGGRDSAFGGGGSSGYSGDRARASSSRGSSSMQSRGGGGANRGGGGSRGGGRSHGGGGGGRR